MSERKGDWIRTSTGVNFYPLDPKPEEIVIYDIAQALSNLCRYNGHMERHYSVAQHSLMVADELRKRGYPAIIQMFGLLHDGSEAYICDIPRPIKPYLTNYFEIEKKLQDMIYERFAGRLPTEEEHRIIKEVDDDALLFEVENYIHFNDWRWRDSNISVEPRMGSKTAIKRYFLDLYDMLEDEIRME
jgi:hypothetical protein